MRPYFDVTEYVRAELNNSNGADLKKFLVKNGFELENQDEFEGAQHLEFVGKGGVIDWKLVGDEVEALGYSIDFSRTTNDDTLYSFTSDEEVLIVRD